MSTSGAITGYIFFILLVLNAASGVVNDSGLVKPPVSLCPKNEERRCQFPCPPETCVTLYAEFLCIANQTCVEGCYCKKGFLRIGQNGPCVPRDQCNPLECVNDANAQRGCGDRCGKTCADYNTTKVCPKILCKKNGCKCKDGYVYDTNLSICVNPKDCTKPCRPNERYSTCLLGECVPKTCDDLGKPLACPAIAADNCPSGCICDIGYVKDKNGNCIDAKSCPSCGGDPNAQIGCGNPCGKTCDSRYANKSDLICPQYCESNGCDCKEGYLLNTGANPPRCVPAEKCPNPKLCTKPHEKYSNCVLGECVPKTCDDLGQSLPCPDIAPPCAGGCICESGYVKDKNGNCIDAKTCPSCGGDPNAQSGCGNPCGRTCASITSRSRRSTSAVACATYCEVNGCDCKPGYILNKNLKPPRCVLPEECNTSLNCTKPHERYIECLAGQCGPKNCSDLDKPIACPFITGPCPGGCICEEGYLRDSEGNCIKLETCPAKTCRANETWTSPCNAPCPYPRCPRNDQPQPPCVPIQPCYPGCQCKLNYLRNSTGHCILAPECPPVKCTRQNEVWNSCPSACLAEGCDDMNNQPKTCNTLIWLCSPRCICKKGYFRNKDGLCVSASQCPSNSPQIATDSPPAVLGAAET